MYYLGRAPVLLPNLWDPEATDTGRVMCDQPPGVAGVGAATVAMQALGLTADQASALVNSQGASSVSATTLTNAINQTVAAAPGLPLAVACNSGRLPITPTVDSALQFLAGDPYRGLLIIQNNEPTGGATLLVSFDPITLSSPAYYLNFGPGGFGILLDRNCPSNPIYLGWSGSPTVGGVIMYGSQPLPKPAAVPAAPSPAVAQAGYAQAA
jgi:hypothetical protein